MFNRVVRITAALLIVSASIALLASALPAAAQTPAPENDESCISCHEDLYLLHDTGKWYCLCEVRARCTDCHGGVAGELDEEAAHTGMIANPVVGDASKCQSCHPDDYRVRLDKFAALGGLSATPCPTEPPRFASAPQPEHPAQAGGLVSWQVGSLALLGVALVVLAWFAYRCWKADCYARRAGP